MLPSTDRDKTGNQENKDRLIKRQFKKKGKQIREYSKTIE